MNNNLEKYIEAKNEADQKKSEADKQTLCLTVLEAVQNIGGKFLVGKKKLHNAPKGHAFALIYTDDDDRKVILGKIEEAFNRRVSKKKN